MYTTYETDLSKSELVYRACEAKFLGESAAGVGKQTYVLTLNLNSQGEAEYESLYPPDVEKDIRPKWVAEGRPAIPIDVADQIEKSLRPTKWMTWKDSRLVP